MAPKFTLLDILYFQFVLGGQFILIPLLAGGLLYLARHRQPSRPMMILLMVLLAPIIGLQLLMTSSVLPPPLPNLSPRAFGGLFRTYFPAWLFLAALVGGSLALWRPSLVSISLLKRVARLSAILSLGMMAINGAVQLTSRLQPAVFQPSAVPDKPQYYLPSRPLKGMKQVGQEISENNVMKIRYQDSKGHMVVMTQTPNSLRAKGGLRCSQTEIQATYCKEIGRIGGGSVIGQPGSAYSQDGWRTGYQNVRASIGSTLFEIYEPTNEHILQDDFLDYFGSFKRVGKKQIIPE